MGARQAAELVHSVLSAVTDLASQGIKSASEEQWRFLSEVYIDDIRAIDHNPDTLHCFATNLRSLATRFRLQFNEEEWLVKRTGVFFSWFQILLQVRGSGIV